MYQNYIFDLYGTLIDIHTDLDSEKINITNRQVIDFANIKVK